VKKAFVRSSLLLLLSLVVFVNASIVAMAASEKRVDLQNNRGLYLTISNVIDEKSVMLYGSMETPVFVSNGPVTVTFEGEKDWGRLYVEYSVDGKLKDGIMDGELEYMTIEGKKFIVHREEYQEFSGKKIDSAEEWVTIDSIDEDYDGSINYPAGAYATLTTPGYYLVWGSKEAVEEDTYVIQVVDKTSNDVVNPKPSVLKAIPNASDVIVNSTTTPFEAYNIKGNNYFKLRDLAAAVNGTEKNFEVTWDAENQSIMLLSEKAYTVIGGELAVSENAVSKEVVPTEASIYLDGEALQFTAYNIGGYNFFMLRDIAAALDIGVTWDEELKKIGIDTSIPYSE
jgi:hypothetical protein